jgi:anti-sigma regulatory factor (Ser/Thr protein kinase)
VTGCPPAVAPEHFKLRIERTETGLARLGGWIDQLVATMGLDASADFAIRLCAEEAVANLIMHATLVPGVDASTVALEVEGAGECIYLRVSDCCAPFDPRTVSPRCAEACDPEGRPGGFGVTLIRNYAREVRYVRDGETNRLILTIDRPPCLPCGGSGQESSSLP